MKTVGIGVIGCGYWGPNLIRNIVELPQMNLVAAADTREERLDHIRNLYPRVRGVSDYHDLFTMGLDAVVIATPPATHFAIAQDCLQHDLNVLVEKPLTLRAEDAEALTALAYRRGLTLMVGHTFEYNPAVHKLKELVDSGELGAIYYIDAVRTNLGLFQPNLNAMWDLAPHDISIVLYILGKDPISVNTQGSASVVPGIYDIVYLNLKFDQKLLAHIHVSWLDPCKVRRITIVGSKKMAVYDDTAPHEKIKVYDRGVDTPTDTDSYADFQFSYRYGDIVAPHIPFVEPLRAECAHFADCIINGAHPRSDGTVGLRIVKVLEAGQRSLDDNGITVPVVPTGSPTRKSRIFDMPYPTRQNHTPAFTNGNSDERSISRS